MIRLVVLVGLLLMLVRVSKGDMYPDEYYRPTTVHGGFKGVNVYKLRYYNHWLIDVNPRIYSSYQFNEKGYVIQTSNYYRDGSVHDNHFTTYDTSGNKIYDDMDYSYRFDNHKQITEKIKSFGTSVFYKVRYKYNTAGLMIEEVVYRPNRINKSQLELRGVYRYKYGKNKHLIEKINNEYSHNYNGTSGNTRYPTTRILYTYNRAGFLIKEATLDNKSKITQKITYRYDDKNNMVEKILFFNDREAFLTAQFKYDEYGNVIEIKNRYADNVLYSKYICIYSK